MSNARRVREWFLRPPDSRWQKYGVWYPLAILGFFVALLVVAWWVGYGM